MRALGWLWWAGSLVIAFPAYFLWVLSEDVSQARVVRVLALMIAVGVVTGLWLMVAPWSGTWVALLASAVWLWAGAALVHARRQRRALPS